MNQLFLVTQQPDAYLDEIYNRNTILWKTSAISLSYLQLFSLNMIQYLSCNSESVILISGLGLLFLTLEQKTCKYDDLEQYTIFFQMVWILLDCKPQ